MSGTDIVLGDNVRNTNANDIFLQIGLDNLQ